VEALNKRYFEENFFRILMLLSIFTVLGSLLIITALILIKGGSAISWEMLTKTPTGGFYLGGGGGILNAIVGSLMLAIPATIIAYFISLFIAQFLQKEFSNQLFARFVRIILDILWGTPSIVYGIFCIVIMVWFGIGTSLIAGIAALTLLEIPIMTRYFDEALKTVPPDLKEAALSLGSSKYQVVVKVMRKQAMPGIIAGVLLGLGRGIGDAASILFTAGFSDKIPTSLFSSAAALPTMIFNLYSSPIPLVRERAYAAAFILLVIVLSLSILSRLLCSMTTRYVVR